MKYEYYKSILAKEELKEAEELANLYELITNKPRDVSNLDIERLYSSKWENKNIHRMALEINKRRWQKRR